MEHGVKSKTAVSPHALCPMLYTLELLQHLIRRRQGLVYIFLIVG
jgi:hypothetical protein